MENYKFLADENELKWFFDHVITKPQEGESYLMCLASRAKKVSMEERARIIGAQIKVLSAPGEGTRVHVRLDRKALGQKENKK